MFDLTRNALGQIINDIKRINLFFNIIIQFLYIAYLIIAISTGGGILAVNIILLVLSCIYTAFFILVSKFGDKKLKRLGKKIYKYSKYILRVFTLGAAVVDIATAEKVSAFDLVFLLAMVAVFVLQIFLEAVLYVLKSRTKRLFEAVKCDLKPSFNLKGFLLRGKGRDRSNSDEKIEPQEPKRLFAKPKKIDDKKGDIVYNSESDEFEEINKDDTSKLTEFKERAGGILSSAKDRIFKNKK